MNPGERTRYQAWPSAKDLCYPFLAMPMAPNPGRFAPITCSPQKVSRFAPLNRYYIILHVDGLFRQFFGNYLFISCMQKKIIHSLWSTFVKDLKRNFSCKIYKKPHKNSKKFFFVPTQKCMK